MIVIKYSKLGNISYVSHVDNMRVLQRSLNRACISVAMSQGFNPHLLTYCSQPLPVGVQSVAEYIAFQPPAKEQNLQEMAKVDKAENEDNSLQEIAKAFDTATPNGITVENVVRVPTNPNIAGRVVACDYECQCELTQEDVVRLEQFFAMNPNIIEIDKKGVLTPTDIAPMVLNAQVQQDCVRMRLKTGNPTLRPDKLIDNINKTVLKDSKIYIVNTIRLNHLVDDGGKLITADELLIRMN